MHLDIYSHGFSVSQIEQRSFLAINRMCKFLGHFELQPQANGRYENIWTGTYAGGFANRQRFQFHINVLDKFIALVKDINPDAVITETVHALWETEHVDMVRRDHRPPRNGQEHAIQFIVEPGITKVICVEPGGGKTYILNQALCKINLPMGMVIKAQYLPKWDEDMGEAHVVEPGDLLIVKGSLEMIKMMRDAKAGVRMPKYILISNATYRAYLDLWETTNGAEDFAYPLNPHELWGVLGREILAIDEGHQDFHFNHRLIIYSHVPKQVILSGTIDPDNEFKHAVTKMTFPPEVRFVLPPIPPYLRITAYVYGFKDRQKIKWTNRGRPDYSQIAFEKSIMQNKRLLESYMDMWANVVRDRLPDFYKPGRKILVFAATKLMCTHMQKHFAKKDCFSKLKVRRFIGGDPYTTLKEADFIVSTTKSCGTAKDVPGLALAVMTEAVGDGQACMQHVKRLRKPNEGPDYFTPEFVYSWCEDIRQHSVYHKKKQVLFATIALSHSTEFSGNLI